MVLCFPVDVVVSVVLSVVICPGVILHKGARAPGVAVRGWNHATTVLLAKAMGVRTSVTAVAPGVAVPAVAVLGAGGSVMPNLVTGAATRPGLEVSWTGGANMANMATHGAEVVHVNDWGGRGGRGGVVQFRGSRGERELEEHSRGRGADSVRDKGDVDGQRGGRAGGVRGGSMRLTLIRGVIGLPADGAGGRGGLALSFVLLLTLPSVSRYHLSIRTLTIYAFSIPILYDILNLGSRSMTPRTPCDLSIPWLVGPVHLPDPEALVLY